MNLSLASSLRLFRSARNSFPRISFAAVAAAMAALLLAGPPSARAQDDAEQMTAIDTKPVLRRHVMLPSSVPSDPSAPRFALAPQVTSKVKTAAVNTGTGIVYTCDSNVPVSTCTYLNTTVAGYYNSVFTNANANIYIEFGDTGLGESDGFINLVHYTPYVTALTKNTGKSSIQTSALSAITTYADPAYSSQNLMGITVALGTPLGFTGLAGINSAETASCTPYTSGCYNEVITVADAAQQAAGGFTLYYDDQGGTETANQYDFYGVVMHETDEVLGTSSCISTDSSTLEDSCDGPDPGSSGIPSAVDLDRYDAPGELANDANPSTAAGQYFSYNGGVDYGAYGYAGTPKVYNTLSNGDDFADYLSSTPDCGTNIAVQDAEGCPGEDQGLSIVDDGQSEFAILNAVGFNIPEASMTSPAPGSTLSGSSATFTWKAATGATGYVLYVGSTGVGSDNIYSSSSAITTTSQAVTGLPTSGTIYVRVWSDVGDVYTSVDYTYTGGTASAATVTLSPTSIAFGSETVGSTTAAHVVTVKNTGTSTVTLTSETITGTDATSFVKSATTCGATLAAAASCTVSVEFKPAATGTLTASLSIADNATGTPQTVALSGTGAAAATYTVSLSATTLTFASTKEGSTSAAQAVTVKNTGTGTVTLTSETITGTDATSFVKSATTCGASLAAAASCTVSVEFKPAATGTLTASLSIADNATGTPQKVALTGTGAAAANTVSLTPASIAFPNTVTGKTSDAQVITLKNTGSVTTTISSIALGGTDPTSFVDLSGCGSTLAVGASCSIYVAFAPASAAALSGKLSVTDTATGSPQSVALTGTGTSAPSVKLSTTSIAFPTTAHGTTSEARPVTLTNGGTATLTLSSITLTGTNPADFEALNTCGPTLAAGASCTVYVAFRPATAAAFKATLSIADNGSASPQSVALSGTGD
ncbi:MAG: choice-of-anchor D domain-containing protein [Acidobacteriaceae bacterium]